ncbi:MAG TPA: type II toxin-antitoxin system VapC family toxin [Urbifossiella sp.]|nr:type II toxin-antitoxin system VapC family toxin [Urbifossiella sp.]
MILLDTDHLTVLHSGRGDRFTRLVVRLSEATESVGTTIVSVEEEMRGWLAAIAKERRPERQVMAYRELAALFDRFAGFPIAPFDAAAAARFMELRSGRGRVGVRDLKIATITITQNALLLTANRRDFEQIPGLRFENWMD